MSKTDLSAAAPRVARWLVYFALLGMPVPSPAAAQIDKPSSPRLRPKTDKKRMDTAITLKPGESYTLALKELASAGYSWTFDVSGDKHAVSVRLASISHAPSPAKAPLIVGAPEDIQLIVKGVVAGSAAVRLIYRRPWEKDSPPAEERLLKVRVR